MKDNIKKHMKKYLQSLFKKRIFIGAMALIGIALIVTNLDTTNKKANKSDHDLIKALDKEDYKKEKESSKELNPYIYKYMRMMRTPIGAGDDYNIEGERSIYEERQIALARREQSILRLSPLQRQMFSRFEGGEVIGLRNNRQGKELSSSKVEWKSRGPGNVPGRTREIVIMPNDPTGNTWLIGTVSGGVWKTTDAGVTWENLTEDITLLATSYLTVSAANPNVIYVGIGEPHIIKPAIFGSGIFKSTDGGKKWTRTPRSENLGQVARMVSDPDNENVVVVATTLGLIRTTDGGETWKNVSPQGTETHFFEDLKVFEGDFNIQYASNDNDDNIYKSTNGGETWISLERFIIINEISRVELAVSRTNPDRVYASISIDRNNSILAVSTDGGASWTYLAEQGDVPFFNFLGGQGFYDNTIMVHPFNDNIVYVGGVQMYRYEVITLNTSNESISEAERIEVSTPSDEFFGDNDGEGINWKVHVDHHNIKAILGKGEKFRIINANDGGISLSDEDENPGIEYDSWNNTDAFHFQDGNGNGFPFNAMTGIVSSQFYAATKVNGEDRYIGGLQDNSTFISPVGESPNANTAYKSVSGGDGFTCLINYANPNEILLTSQFNKVYYSSDGGETIRTTSGFMGESPFLSWITNSNRLPTRVFSAHSNGVEVSEDFGQTWNHTLIRDSLWRNRYRSANFNVRVAVNDCNPNVIVAGSVFGKSNIDGTQFPIYVSTNGGKTFDSKYITNIDTRVAAGVGALNTSPINDQVIYVGLQIRGPGVGKLFRSNDLGETWEDLSGFSQEENRGFPDAAVFDVIEMPYNDQIIWVSTDIGIVCSVNSGKNWALLDTDLPAVAVHDMQIVNDQVVLSTYGRGIWSVTIPELADVNLEPIQNVFFDTEIYQKPGTKQMFIEYKFDNNLLDSVQVLVKGERLTTIKDIAPNKEGIYSFESNNTESQKDTISFIHFIPSSSRSGGYCDGPIKIESFRLVDYVDYLPPSINYQNDFESGGNDFASLNTLFQFTVSTPKNLDDNALHNADIPYLAPGLYKAYLRVPIIVVGENPSIEFEHMALNAFDTIFVEATKDGKNWETILGPIDGYDLGSGIWASEVLDWLYNRIPPKESSFRKAEIKLLNTFEANDTIALRFVFNANVPNSDLWGYAIDDINVSPPTISLEPDPQAIEGSLITVTATLKGDIYSTVTVNKIALNPGTASASDYDEGIIPTLVLTFKPGETSKTFTIQTNDDSVHEGDEQFTIAIAKVTNAAIESGTVTATIIDNDPEMSLFPNPVNDILNIRINEKSSGQIGVLIYNESGQIVYKSEFKKRGTFVQEKINLQYLATGFYVVVISTPEGTKRHKILKQ